VGLRPPRFARLLVKLLAAAEEGEFLVSDLDERFRQIASEEGPRAARRWYRRQALTAIPVALLPDVDLLRRRSWTGAIGDLRLGMRSLRRRPLFALGVAGTLGLGLTAGVVTLAVAWRVWLAPLPIPDSERVVRLYEIEPADGPAGPPADPDERRHLLSDQLALDLHEHEWRTIDEVAFVMGRASGLQETLDGATYTVSRLALPTEGFELLGIVPTLGRVPAVVEEETLLSERFWRNALGGDPDVIGSRFTHAVGPSPTIVGVAPLPDGYPGDADIVQFFDWRVQVGRELRWYEVFARLKPGHSVEAAEAEMNAFLDALAEIHPEHRGWAIDAVPLKDDLIAPFRGVIALLLAAGTTFLLLATVNVLGLVAARRVEGRRERSIRVALGASEARLLRGSVAESLVLAGVGTLAAVLASRWLAPAMGRMVPQDVPRLAELTVGAPILGTALVVGLAVGAATGLMGYAVSRAAQGVPSRGRKWLLAGGELRRVLVVGQVALTTLLTAGGAAIIHRVSTLRAIDLGFEAEGVLTTFGNLNSIPRYDRSHDAFLDAMRTIIDRLETRGVEAAASYNTPMSPTYGEGGVVPFPIRADSASEDVFYELHPVLGDYFSVMDVEMLAGRALRASDDATTGNVVVVSEDFVRRFFHTTHPEDALGRTLEGIILLPDPATIVGVARSTRHRGPDSPTTADIYISYAQQRTIAVAELLVSGEAERVMQMVPEVLEEVTPDVAWSPLEPYTSRLGEWYAPFRFQLLTIGLLTGLGLLLASLGLYALMAYQVAIRRQELGIRKALGASDERLIRGVVLPGIATSTIGAGLGLLAWYWLLPWTEELLEGVDAAGPVVPLAVALVVGVSCLAATLVPAVRATRVDPVVTLKVD
jgi:putative ABC transport system permease protein